MDLNFVGVKGKSVSFLNTGNMVYTAVVLVTNFKIFIVSYSFNILMIVSVVGSILLYFAVYLLETLIFPTLEISTIHVLGSEG